MTPAQQPAPAPSGRLASLMEQHLTTDDLHFLKRLQFLSRQRIKATRMGGHKARLKGGTTEFAEHRAYAPGDEIRRLDWRILGRSDRMEIKLFEDPSAADNLLLVDGSGSMNFTHSARPKYNYARSVVAFMGKLLLTQRDPVGLQLANAKQSLFLPPASGNNQLFRMLETLTSHPPGGPTRLAEQLRQLAKQLRNPTRILMLTDAFTSLPQLEQELRMLRTRGHRFVMLQILAPEELHLNYGQPLKFTSLEDREAISADPTTIRQGYLDALRQHIEALRKICLHYGASYELLVTDRPVGESLAAFIRRQSRSRR